MNEDIKAIENYLEMMYTGARAMDDEEAMLRIARAIKALKADVHEDLFIAGFEKDFSQYMNPPVEDQ